MNRQECDVLRALFAKSFINQRILAETAGHSLGIINRSIKSLMEAGYLDENMQPTESAKQICRQRAPRNAVILAAGFGMRMIPINLETPKALLEVNGEPLIERTIRQLHDAGITEIYVVVGFMKEQFEYLIDEFGVELVVNPQYAAKNNIWSLRLVLDRLSNSYIIPCDIWCAQNPFSRYEMNSWYMVSDRMDNDSSVRVNRSMELVTVSGNGSGNTMIGIAYLLEEECEILRKRIELMCRNEKNNDAFWESALYENGRMIVPARLVKSSDAVEINTYEQLRELDGKSNHLRSEALETIGEVFHTSSDSITDITVLKKGMTNRSFLFTYEESKYIMRVPGEGTKQLINRRHEAEVYRAIQGKGLCDAPVFIDPCNGYKITKYLDGVRVADKNDENDLTRCMDKLRKFHGMKLKVNHEFNIFGQIEFYETLWEGQPSIYKDYKRTKANVLSLRSYIEAHTETKVLTHMDAVPDNFLFYKTDDGEQLQLTDWEYAGMQDPHVDIAMFCIYSLYDKSRADRLIDIYFCNQCPKETRTKIYCYIAACGLLWSNWCEYKSRQGVEFGEYSLRQYRYAKDYYKIVQNEIGEEYV